MPSIDMPLEKLREYQPALTREADFEEYWRSTITDAMSQPLNAELIPFDLPSRGVQCYAVRYEGFGGGRIAGWYLRPDSAGKLPGVCVYHGYSGRAPRPLDLLAIAQQGICVLGMDCRGQNGQSHDAATYPEGAAPGWMTQGIRDPRRYYYRSVFADAVRALEVLARREEIDESRLAVTGVSQGGGLTLAVSALSERPILSLPDIPYLCDYRRAIAIAPAGPYPEIPTFLKAFPDLVEPALRTLSYCDNLNLAPWMKCRTVTSNCLCDDSCPPSTIFAVFNHLVCPKQIEIYPFHKHEVPYEHRELQFRLLTETLLGSTPAKSLA